MRFADDQDLGSDGFSAEERGRYMVIASMRETCELLIRNIKTTTRIAVARCPAAVPALERAEANMVTAIEEMRRDLAVMMGDE